MQHLLPNTTLKGGQYRIERVLGQGGFGNTYEGYNTVFNERIAIKEFYIKGVTERDETTSAISVSNDDNKQHFEEQLEKFKKEALRIRKLNNPNIVKVHDLFEENGTAYYVMDYVDGENLSERLKRTGKPMTEQEVREILPQILDALKTVHNAGFWHLDLKPANIMIDRTGGVRLIDFGASKQLNAQKGGATTSTAISFTNGYAPREQMEQSYDKFGPWTDIYALGATLYNLLTNNRPPMPSDIDDDISVDKHNALPFPASISAEMKQLVLKMLKTNRMQRPQSIESVVALMEDRNLESEKDDETTMLSPNGSLSDEETIFIPTNSSPLNKPDVVHNSPNPNGAKSNSAKYIIIGVVVLILLFVLGKLPSNDSPSSQGSESQELLKSGGNSEKGVTKDFSYYEQAAESGDPVAQNKLGNMYAEGKGCAKNSSKAAYYYRLAAEQGNKYAQHNLGFCYWDGNGVSQDREEAIKWLRLSAEQGYKPAIKFLRNNGIE